jgi:hypothetical protein
LLLLKSIMRHHAVESLVGVEYLHTVSVANTVGASIHNVPSNLQTVRVVSPVPGDENFTSLDRAPSSSSFESMHSIDHGSLGLDSIQHQYEASAEGGGPWVATPRPANPVPGCFEAFHETSSASFRRPAEIPSQEYSGPDIAVHYLVCTSVTLCKCYGESLLCYKVHVEVNLVSFKLLLAWRLLSSCCDSVVAQGGACPLQKLE